MAWGPQVPEGFLPAYSVDTEAEAKLLVVMTCPKGQDGEYYSRELVRDQSLEQLAVFSDRLDAAHERLVEVGSCRCSAL